MKNVSPFFYIHADLSGNECWNKIGIGITPYSVVRARQKYCSQPFYIDHLYFGEFDDISKIERYFKSMFKHQSAKYLLKSNATELFKMKQDDIVNEINRIIIRWNLKIKKLDVSKYSSSSSQNCILKIPSEDEAYCYSKDLITKMFYTSRDKELS